MNTPRRFGWIPQEVDTRDKKFSLTAPAVLPKVVDPLGIHTAFIKDQGNLGACTGHASTTALEIVLGKGHYSRLMAYYEARSIEDTVHQDVGAQIRDVIKSF